MVDPGVLSFELVIERYCEIILFNEDRINSKHQKSNLKQIPMTQIQNSK
ncbi:hypothetical protein D1AOALGA4SA_7024 [Olavius algarvensis Delta 1 endosymbiont]|nr:hypothetical protein D1AOALGA4SA_7024 [Olavius algarvensis Delta 1 endosymbiont]